MTNSSLKWYKWRRDFQSVVAQQIACIIKWASRIDCMPVALIMGKKNSLIQWNRTGVLNLQLRGQIQPTVLACVLVFGSGSPGPCTLDLEPRARQGWCQAPGPYPSVGAEAGSVRSPGPNPGTPGVGGAVSAPQNPIPEQGAGGSDTVCGAGREQYWASKPWSSPQMGPVPLFWPAALKGWAPLIYQTRVNISDISDQMLLGPSGHPCNLCLWYFMCGILHSLAYTFLCTWAEQLNFCMLQHPLCICKWKTLLEATFGSGYGISPSRTELDHVHFECQGLLCAHSMVGGREKWSPVFVLVQVG